MKVRLGDVVHQGGRGWRSQPICRSPDWRTEVAILEGPKAAVTCMACIAERDSQIPGVPVLPTKANLHTVVDPLPGSLCMVSGDPDPSNNGLWVYSGVYWYQAAYPA